MKLAYASILSFVAVSTLITGCSVATETEGTDVATSELSGANVTFGYSRSGFGDPTTSASLTAGTTIRVSYDALRVVSLNPRCAYEPSSRDGVPRTSINMGVKLNGDPSRVYTFERVSLYGAEGVDRSTVANDSIALPLDTRSVELWFFCKAKESGFVAYDSKGGANYKLEVAPMPAFSPIASVKTVFTGRRNAIDASRWTDSSIFPGRGDSYYYPTHVSIAYDVLDGFADGKDEITAHIGVSKHTQGRGWRREHPMQWHDVTLRREGKRFVGGHYEELWGGGGSDETRIDAIDVALDDRSGNHDSDFGRNYRVNF